ncbi:MAG: plasmid stabilization protein [Pseudomonadota bacterium]|nr:plasmid stabilization protein [Pseudomonadota bacterium]
MPDITARSESLPVIDTLIAATANTHSLIVATRNVRHIVRCQAKVFNPWDMPTDG